MKCRNEEMLETQACEKAKKMRAGQKFSANGMALGGQLCEALLTLPWPRLSEKDVAKIALLRMDFFNRVLHGRSPQMLLTS